MQLFSVCLCRFGSHHTPLTTSAMPKYPCIQISKRKETIYRRLSSSPFFCLKQIFSFSQSFLSSYTSSKGLWITWRMMRGTYDMQSRNINNTVTRADLWKPNPDLRLFLSSCTSAQVLQAPATMLSVTQTRLSNPVSLFTLFAFTN